MGGRSDLCCTRFGTSFRARKWLALDPCGILCVNFSLGLHIFSLVTIALKLISHSKFSTIFYYAVYIPTATLAILSLYMAWTTDPGAVPMGARPLTTFRRSGTSDLKPSSKNKRGMRRCHKCNDNYKPPRAHHDSVTGRCIVKMDHFCPWVGNAIGALNHKFFVLFIFYTFLTSLQAMLLIVVRLIRCGYTLEELSGDEPEGAQEADWNTTGGGPQGATTKNIYDDPARWLGQQAHPKYTFEGCDALYEYNLVVALLVVSIVFMIFTCSMLVEQVDAIESNTGKIARMKMSVGQGGTELSRVTHAFNEMFGGDSPKVTWHWFLPLRVKFPKGMDKVVLGYEWDESFDPVPYQSPEDVADTPADASIVAGDKDDGQDLESGLVGDPNSVASLGDDSVHSVESSLSSAQDGVRKRQSGDTISPKTLVERTSTGLT